MRDTMRTRRKDPNYKTAERITKRIKRQDSIFKKKESVAKKNRKSHKKSGLDMDKCIAAFHDRIKDTCTVYKS